MCFFFFSSRRRHTRLQGDWSSDVCSSDLLQRHAQPLLDQDARAVDVLEPGDQVAAGGERGGPVREAEGLAERRLGRSEERRVGKEWRSRGVEWQWRKRKREIERTRSMEEK